jgi:hypothetical protein
MQGIFLENSIEEGHPESKHHLHMALTQVSTPASSMKSRPGPKWFSLAANIEGIFGWQSTMTKFPNNAFLRTYPHH